MKKFSKANAASRAITGLLSVALVTSGMTVVAAPAFAEQKNECSTLKAAPGKGLDGTYSITDADTKNFEPGATVTITGKDVPAREGGFMALKLDKGNAKWDAAAQNEVNDLSVEGDGSWLKLPADSFAGGEFSVKVVLPSDLADGQHVLSLLVGNDGKDGKGGQNVGFSIDAQQLNDRHCGTHGNAVTKVTGYPVDDRFGYLAGQIVVAGVVEGLTPSTEVTFTLDGAELQDAPKLSTDEKGNVEFSLDKQRNHALIVPPGKALAGEHKLKVTAGETSAELKFTTDVYAAIDHAGAQGSAATANVANLPAGAKVTAVGIEGTDWWTGEEAPAENGSVAIADVKIPADAALGAPINVTYTVGGEKKTVKTGVVVSAPDAPVGVDAYNVTTANLGPGLYQTAINNLSQELFVTRSNRTWNTEKNQWLWDSTLYKLDATTLAVKQELPLGPSSEASLKDEPSVPVFGIGLDNRRGLIWTTSSKLNTVTIYRQSDLSVVKQWPKNTIGHPHDVVVDEKTGNAWVSSDSVLVGGKEDKSNGSVWILDPNDDTNTKSVSLGQFQRPMSLEFDPASRFLYTVSRETPQIAKVNVDTQEVKIFEMPQEKIKFGSGVALDTDKNELYVTAQKSGNTLVFNANDGSLVKEIHTGAGALNARYNPADHRVYVAHRDASTVVAIDTETKEIVARFDGGVWFNHITVGADGTVYAVDKASMNPASPDRQHDHLFAFKLKEMPGNGGSSNDQSGSSTQNGELPTWASALISIASILGILGILAGLAPHIAKFFNIRLPF